MSGLSPIKAKELIKILKKIGFIERRQKGSHLFLSHEDGRTTVVPIHPSKSIGIGLLRSILRDVKLSPEDFGRLK
ncbi:type II toxin-antitoxin system HicA family toxin [Candidatus Daviesbacteria bacterium]|nr:type II toxin-antitoxin system HicA family toxin [Candidatus Daviesbacteria bacterium]